jgi:hypothetical protein
MFPPPAILEVRLFSVTCWVGIMLNLHHAQLGAKIHLQHFAMRYSVASQQPRVDQG